MFRPGALLKPKPDDCSASLFPTAAPPCMYRRAAELVGPAREEGSSKLSIPDTSSSSFSGILDRPMRPFCPARPKPADEVKPDLLASKSEFDSIRPLFLNPLWLPKPELLRAEDPGAPIRVPAVREVRAEEPSERPPEPQDSSLMAEESSRLLLPPPPLRAELPPDLDDNGTERPRLRGAKRLEEKERPVKEEAPGSLEPNRLGLFLDTEVGAFEALSSSLLPAQE